MTIRVQQEKVMFPRNVGRKEAAVERTGMYLQRVLESIIFNKPI